MSQIHEITVPDIGDFKDIPVIEILVAVGDEVEIDQALITLESDKATLEVPSPIKGRVEKMLVSLGDKVSRGSAVATLAIAAGPAETTSASAPAAPASVSPAPAQATQGKPQFDLVVIGAGPGGYSAGFRAADLGLSVALVEKHETLGGVCLNVGCIPSKALLHVAAVTEEAVALSAHGVSFGAPEFELEKLRSFKSATVGKLTDGLKQMAKMRKVAVIKGKATFASAHSLTVEDGERREEITFGSCVIAAGSSAVHLPFLPVDPRIVDSTGALELPEVPKRMLVIGGGIIGLEMATVYSALGAKIDVVERLDRILTGVDRDAVEIWRKQNAHRFQDIFVNTSVISADAKAEGIAVTFEGAVSETRTYDLVLQSAGRRPNGRTLGIEAAGLSPDDRGFIPVDRQMRTAQPNIYAIGDVAGDPMLAHKAVHEGHVAAEAAAGHKAFFDARVIPSVAYTSPEIAWVGLTEDAADNAGTRIGISKFPWSASGRAIANGASYGMTKLVFDAETHRVIGGVIVGPNAGDLIGEVCLAIEMGADAVDIGKTIHPHPTLGETVGMAAELFEGVCTDLPPAKPKFKN
ncbi:dihydrolipoyl dehydrogenase [Rhizobium sp. B230/85]|uniref:dihydrolipoyl dehydrogenase n=1 Tax=unclassified Rhizobium TaxID=2613769 RepID=UPI001ADD428F|nr:MULTISPECIES: dihydrolipoyl dehydrogenase [unclassified Rhizobium]MBO9136459.1 dihydrolipoyl dehydrogenase [Rhizobium sp. B209b/85]QXZ98659.1 dihydrolipoyl dehydrogenase [Rhizobium sp. B230/85]